MLTLNIAPIKARLAAVSPGEWGASYRPEGSTTVWRHEAGAGRFTVAEVCSWDRRRENAEFIANAPADIAALLAEIERLRDVA